MADRYYIVNSRTKMFVEIDGKAESWDSEWKERYPHTKGEPWENVFAASLHDSDRANGIYYTYDLCCSGGLYVLWADRTKHTEAMIAAAKAELRRQQDVVSLRVRVLTPLK